PATVDNPYFGYAVNRVMQGSLPSPPGNGQYRRSKAALPGQVILFSESQNNYWPSTDGYRLGIYAPTPVPPRHSGGMNFVFVDGHAQWYTQDDYSRTVAEVNNTTGSQIEWSQTRKIYWWPCRTCKKL